MSTVYGLSFVGGFLSISFLLVQSSSLFSFLFSTFMQVSVCLVFVLCHKAKEPNILFYGCMLREALSHVWCKHSHKWIHPHMWDNLFTWTLGFQSRKAIRSHGLHTLCHGNTLKSKPNILWSLCLYNSRWVWVELNWILFWFWFYSHEHATLILRSNLLVSHYLYSNVVFFFSPVLSACIL